MVGAVLGQLLALLLAAIVVAVALKLAPLFFVGVVRCHDHRQYLARFGPLAELVTWVAFFAGAGMWL
jgi:hypothetical protein